MLKKSELKELAQKAKELHTKKIKVKAAEYDKLKEMKIQLLETPKPFKKTTKKEKQVKKNITTTTTNNNNNNNNNNSLEEKVSMLSIQQN